LRVVVRSTQSPVGTGSSVATLAKQTAATAAGSGRARRGAMRVSVRETRGRWNGGRGAVLSLVSPRH
jgi:hypothetical protein